jgi:hypothetical protein
VRHLERANRELNTDTIKKLSLWRCGGLVHGNSGIPALRLEGGGAVGGVSQAAARRRHNRVLGGGFGRRTVLEQLPVLQPGAGEVLDEVPVAEEDDHLFGPRPQPFPECVNSNDG